MAALFSILRGHGQEVYGKVHKTLRGFLEKGVIEMEGSTVCWKPPTEAPALISLQVIKGEDLLPASPPLPPPAYSVLKERTKALGSVHENPFKN